MSLESCTIASPVGELWIAAGEQGLAALLFDDEPAAFRASLLRRLGPVASATAESARLRPIATALARYFEGDLRALDALAVETPGTPFQQAVWAELRRIPAGAPIGYAALAARLGAPRAVRAVAAANGRNPVGIVVPCHRVIGSDGALVGYRGGLIRKRWLLEHEGWPTAAVAFAG